MQLFTIDLYKLNPDGSQQLDSSNQPIPTYDQAVVESYAHVFTGWYWSQSGTPTWNYVPANYRQPMLAFPDHHDTCFRQVRERTERVCPCFLLRRWALDVERWAFF